LINTTATTDATTNLVALPIAGLMTINEIRTTRGTPPLLALRGHEKARSMSGLWNGGGA
jgi:hypothetical protein